MSKKRPEYNIVLCRYSEVALKGKNRWIFEQKIIDRINCLLKTINNLTIKKIWGRILIHHHDYSIFSNEEIEKISKRLYDDGSFPKVHAFKNKMLKDKKNPRTILHALIRCHLTDPGKDAAWAYCTKIIQVENGNYNEADFKKTTG